MATHTGGLTGDAQAVRIEGLVRSFGDRKILDRLELSLEAGEFVALLGHSGSGKSTLLRALAGLDHEVEGSGELSAPGDVSVVFQDARLLPWKRVLDNVVLGLTGAGARERGRAALAEVGLAGREDAWPADLSGGEQQRVSLARSLVREPQLLLADEPFGALDALTRIRMHALLRRLCEAHRPAVLLVTHDVDEAIALADRVVVLDAGRIAADVRVELPAPRGQGSPEYAALRGRLLRQLGVELDDGEPVGIEPGGRGAAPAQDRGAAPAQDHGPEVDAAVGADGDPRAAGRRTGAVTDGPVAAGAAATGAAGSGPAATRAAGSGPAGGGAAASSAAGGGPAGSGAAGDVPASVGPAHGTPDGADGGAPAVGSRAAEVSRA
ncbi:hypothetical protein GCM10010449_23220 [Streptomyces rectiviolaceus]|uniref:ABC transporter domain-containing protein n=1 Tax=Streptomyces rectiviolaceus TaxID=332591 RepID=A0ABP6MC02_9ACTN